jgi:hypothetical protein
MPKKPKGPVRSLEERLRYARKINEFRKANPRMTLQEAIEAIVPEISASDYYRWNDRLTLADATRKANGEAPAVQHFPLAAIPAKAARRVAKPAMAKTATPRDDDKHLAATLLEVAARLLKR